jgi:hypothetical protein
MWAQYRLLNAKPGGGHLAVKDTVYEATIDRKGSPVEKF